MEKMSRVTTALSSSALTGRTMHCHLDAPANAISVCRDAAQVVVAGRSIFKIYAIEEEQFVEKLNLRVGRKPSLNLSCADVVWHQMDENLLATAATNGVVVTWNLGRPSRNKQDQLFTEHKRTVNKVCFHPTEAHVLLSGSQDGFMKCFDLRRKDSVSTFSGEAHRDRLGEMCVSVGVQSYKQVEMRFLREPSLPSWRLNSTGRKSGWRGSRLAPVEDEPKPWWWGRGRGQIGCRLGIADEEGGASRHSLMGSCVSLPLSSLCCSKSTGVIRPLSPGTWSEVGRTRGSFHDSPELPPPGSYETK